MAVDIVVQLVSNPSTIAIGQTATLRLTLRSDAPPEVATVTFTVTGGSTVFQETGTTVLTKTVNVSGDTLSTTPYTLAGPPGPRSVQIDVEVTPNVPPSKSGTAVVIS